MGAGAHFLVMGGSSSVPSLARIDKSLQTLREHVGVFSAEDACTLQEQVTLLRMNIQHKGNSINEVQLFKECAHKVRADTHEGFVHAVQEWRALVAILAQNRATLTE